MIEVWIMMNYDESHNDYLIADIIPNVTTFPTSPSEIIFDWFIVNISINSRF